MPANLNLTSSGGAILKTDADASTFHYQQVKVVFGAVGSAYNTVTSAVPLPVVNNSSGVVQVLTTGAYLINLTNFSGAGAVVTSSAGVMVTITSSYLVVLSSPTSLSSGTVTLSSNITVINASSGTVQVLTSGTLVVQNTSSGRVQVIPVASITSSGLNMALLFATSGAPTVQNITTAPAALYAYECFGSTATPSAVKVYNSTGPTIGSTTGLVKVILIPGSTGSGGANMALPAPGVYASGGLSIIITANINGTDTGNVPAVVAANFDYMV